MTQDRATRQPEPDDDLPPLRPRPAPPVPADAVPVLDEEDPPDPAVDDVPELPVEDVVSGNRKTGGDDES